MKKFLIPALVCVFGLTAVPAMADDNDYDHDDRVELQAKQAAKISHERAKQIAIKAVGGGKVVDIDFDVDNGRPHYDVEVVKGRTKWDVKVDANTGKVFRKRIDR